MNIQTRDRDGVMIIMLDGRWEETFDSQSFEATMDVLLEEDKTKICIDAHKLVYMGSTAMGLLVRYLKRVRQKGGSLVLFRVRKAVDEALRSLKLDRLLTLCSTEDEAVSMLQQPAAGIEPAEDRVIDTSPVFDTSKINVSALRSGPLIERATVIVKVPDQERQQAFGRNQSVGRIIYLDSQTMKVHFDTVKRERKAGRSRRQHMGDLTDEQWQAAFPAESPVKLKFRLPLYRKAHYFELEGSVKACETEADDEGTFRQLSVEFGELRDEARTDIVQFIKDLTYLETVVER